MCKIIKRKDVIKVQQHRAEAISQNLCWWWSHSYVRINFLERRFQSSIKLGIKSPWVSLETLLSASRIRLYNSKLIYEFMWKTFKKGKAKRRRKSIKKYCNLCVFMLHSWGALSASADTRELIGASWEEQKQYI